MDMTKINMHAVRERYLKRERIHMELRRLFNDGAIYDYIQLALGISNGDGNYSASEHGLGPKILAKSTEEAVFNLVNKIEKCSNTNHLPELIYYHSPLYLGISVGSEIAMMLNPNNYWVCNVRTIWAHLLLKHKGNEQHANQELGSYRGGEPDSEMDYGIWPYIYTALENSLLQIGRESSQIAQTQGIIPGTLRFLWPDVVASVLYDNRSTT